MVLIALYINRDVDKTATTKDVFNFVVLPACWTKCGVYSCSLVTKGETCLHVGALRSCQCASGDTLTYRCLKLVFYNLSN